MVSRLAADFTLARGPDAEIPPRPITPTGLPAPAVIGTVTCVPSPVRSASTAGWCAKCVRPRRPRRAPSSAACAIPYAITSRSGSAAAPCSTGASGSRSARRGALRVGLGPFGLTSEFDTSVIRVRPGAELHCDGVVSLQRGVRIVVDSGKLTIGHATNVNGLTKILVATEVTHRRRLHAVVGRADPRQRLPHASPWAARPAR